LLEVASGVVPQGKLVKAVKETWKFAWKRMMAELAPQDRDGSYRRPKYGFDGRIGSPEFPDEPYRYQLYVGNPCPWCHRCVLAVKLLGFDEASIGVTRLVDDPTRASRGGWIFDPGYRGGDPDPLFGSADLREVYDRLRPGYRGRCTAPLLVDKKARRVVSNESADIVRMLNSATLGRKDRAGRLDLYPESLAPLIDETNEWVYRQVNNGVYRCGFATTQRAYDAASADVRAGLRRCDDVLATRPYLCGTEFTESDLRLLPTAIRFDGAYAPLFRAGGAHLRLRSDYPHVHEWLRRCWTAYDPAIRDSIDVADACTSYYKQLFPLNPGGIVPSPVTAEALGLEG